MIFGACANRAWDPPHISTAALPALWDAVTSDVLCSSATCGVHFGYGDACSGDRRRRDFHERRRGEQTEEPLPFATPNCCSACSLRS
jgi:hypothetical protein